MAFKPTLQFHWDKDVRDEGTKTILGRGVRIKAQFGIKGRAKFIEQLTDWGITIPPAIGGSAPGEHAKTIQGGVTWTVEFSGNIEKHLLPRHAKKDHNKNVWLVTGPDLALHLIAAGAQYSYPKDDAVLKAKQGYTNIFETEEENG